MAGILACAESVYVIDGPPVCDRGLWIPTRMTVVQLHSGALLVRSPLSIALEVRQ